MTRSRAKPVANPFAALLVASAPVPPVTGACTVVVAGVKVTDEASARATAPACWRVAPSSCSAATR
mgnify:CR=1 FL=1